MTNRRDTDPEFLLAHTGWIRGLSRHLVRDQHLADDLAQDACVAALEHPEQVERSPRAWLGSVLRNRARESARRDERRHRRERLATPTGAAPSTADVVARAQMQGTLVQAVLALSETYREVVLLRFFEDLPPRRIAKRLDVPVSTVHTRLTRAIARLRTELDRRHGDDRATWIRSIAPFAAPSVGVTVMKTALLGTAALILGGTMALSVHEDETLSRPTSPPDATAVGAATEDLAWGEPPPKRPRRDDSPTRSTPVDRTWPVESAEPAEQAELGAVPVAPPQPTTTPTPAPTPVRPPSRQALVLKANELEKLREQIAAYFLARSEEDYKGMTRAFSKITAWGDVASLAPEDLRYVLSAPIDPERSSKRGIVIERRVDVPLVAGRSMPIDYLLHLPKRYRHGTPTPTLLALPPPFERLDKIKAWFAETFPAELRDEVIVVVPRRAEAPFEWSTDEGRQRACFALVDVYRRFDVDRERLFLDGAAEDVDGFVTSLPTLFAGVVRRDGADVPLEPKGNVAHLARLDLGSGAPDRSATSVGAFVTTSRKTFAPHQLGWTVRSFVEANAYWVQLTHPDQEFDPNDPLRIEASIDRNQNTIRVTTDGRVRGFTVYLNDDVADLDAVVRVVHTVRRADGHSDSRTVFADRRSRNLEFALGCWYLNLSGNLGEAYVDSIEIEVD